MDISDEYRNMCRKAEEIQGSWECQLGDFYRQFGSTMIWGVNDEADNHGSRAIVNIWLPRQDQLQEMYQDHIGISCCPFTLTDVLHCTMKDDCENHKHKGVDYADFGSLERVWLQFVMFELHKKIWVKDDWLEF